MIVTNEVTLVEGRWQVTLPLGDVSERELIQLIHEWDGVAWPTWTTPGSVDCDFASINDAYGILRELDLLDGDDEGGSDLPEEAGDPDAAYDARRDAYDA